MTWGEIDRLVDGLAARLPAGSRCWGVPRGGSVVAAMLRAKHGVSITADSSEATIAVDDLIDSGRAARVVKRKYDLNLEPLLVKENNEWIVFPWEGTELSEDAENTVTRMLQQIGEDPARPELEDTPRRVAQCWESLFSGYRHGNGDVAQFIESSAAGETATPAVKDGMLVVAGIPFISSCERHLLPFFGTADAAWLPRGAAKEGMGDVLGLVDALARRLQTPQRLAGQICDALAGNTEGAAVRLKGTCICRMALGLDSGPSEIGATAFGGGFRAGPELQSRFLSGLP